MEKGDIYVIEYSASEGIIYEGEDLKEAKKVCHDPKIPGRKMVVAKSNKGRVNLDEYGDNCGGLDIDEDKSKVLDEMELRVIRKVLEKDYICMLPGEIGEFDDNLDIIYHVKPTSEKDKEIKYNSQILKEAGLKKGDKVQVMLRVIKGY